MRKLFIGASIALAVAFSAGSVFAASIQNRFGVTGRLGFIAPSDSDFNDFKLNSDVGFIGGGGIIYGFDKNIALEFDITHSIFDVERPSGIDMGEFNITNYSFSAQYRFADPYPKLTPYAGAGFDILVGDYDRGDVDTVLGAHVQGGADYFILPNVALNAELKAVIAPEADITGAAGGNFDPSHVSGMFGGRFFF